MEYISTLKKIALVLFLSLGAISCNDNDIDVILILR